MKFPYVITFQADNIWNQSAVSTKYEKFRPLLPSYLIKKFEYAMIVIQSLA